MRKATDRIECPQCGAEIPITATLQQQLTEQIRKEHQEELAAAERRLKTKEKKLEQREAEIAAEREGIDEQVQARVTAERPKLLKEAERKAQELFGSEMEDIRTQLGEKTKKLAEAQKQEIEFRKRERALEEAKKELELQVERRLSEERGEIEERVTNRILEERRMKDAERDALIGELKHQLDVAKQKAEQGSQQLQGEVRELHLESMLRESFPFDVIEPVAKGVRGADVLHRVCTRGGAACGTILWETKRTRNWNDGWIEKLKADQRDAKSDIAVIVTDVLPREISTFGLRDTVWVTNPSCVLPVAVALRSTVAQVAFARKAAEHKDEKIEVLYTYLTGAEFRQRVEAVVEAFAGLTDDLNKEKRSTMARWAKREKYIERAVGAIAGMHGDFRGLLGASIQPIAALEMDDDAPEEGGQTEGGSDEDLA